MSRRATLLVGGAGAALIVAVGLALASCGGKSGGAPVPTEQRGAGSTGPSSVAPWRLVYATEVAGRAGLDVYVVDVPGGKPRRVAGLAGRDDFSPSWSPDRKTIAYRLNQ